MLNVTSNIFIFCVFGILLLAEYLFFRFLDVSYSIAWMCTIALYFVFMVYQVLVKLSDDMEKNRIKVLLDELFDAIYGIPLVNKNEKMVIKWDIVFKKLIDRNQHELYDKIMRETTKKIDHYVNLYPSLLLNSGTNLKENKFKNFDLNSLVLGNKKDAETEVSNKSLIDDSEVQKKLFIKEIRATSAVFTNYDASTLIEVALNDENEPDEAQSLIMRPSDVIDGFSIAMFYNNTKYIVAPRIAIINKRINKELWFYRHLNKLLAVAESLVKGEQTYALIIEAKDLLEYTLELPQNEREKKMNFVFQGLIGEFLVFSNIYDETETKAFCELTTGYNSFEVVLKKIEISTKGKKETKEISRTIAIGNSYQPLVTVLEKLAFINNNIKIIVDNRDLSDIVIK